MGVANYPILDLLQKVRSWASIIPDMFSESLMSSAGDRSMCSESRECLGSPGFGFRCRGCGLLLCRKCVLAVATASYRTEQQPVLCNLCFHVDNGSWEAAQSHGTPGPFISPKSPLSRSSTDRLSHLVELQQLSCSCQLHCSTYRYLHRFSHPSVDILDTFTSSSVVLFAHTCRGYKDDQGDGYGKQFSTPMSAFSQESSDIDSMSIIAGNELYSLRSANSSPFHSPCLSIEQELASPLLQQTLLFSQDSPDHQYIKHRADSEDLLENTSDSISENGMIYHDQNSQKATEHCDFENDRVFYPPIPADEQDDNETNFFGYIDEDDDESSRLLKTISFSSNHLDTREKANESHKEALKSVVHAHFRALVSQLLKGEGVCAGSDQKGQSWLEVISSLAWQAANFIKPDTSHGGSMDPGDYVKVKCIASGSPSDSTLVKGVVCTKNVKHKRMISLHRNPRLLLLGGALEYQKAPNELASIVSVLEKETNYMNTMLSKIEALHPNVLLVEKNASSYTQEYLFERKEVSLVLNVKKPLLERISRCTGAQIVPSIDGVSSARLGHCEMFRIEKVYEEFSSEKKPSKTLMFFEGCPSRLGCTVLLRGACLEELKKLKHVIQYASFAAYHLSLERSFLVDEGASLPKFPIVPIELPKKLTEADQFHSTVSSVTASDETVSNNHQNDRSCTKVGIESVSSSSDVIHSNKEIVEHISDPQNSNSLFELTNIPDMNGFSNPHPEQNGTFFRSSPHVCLCGSSGTKTCFSCKEPTYISLLFTNASNHQGVIPEQSVKGRSYLSNDWLLINHHSILVSLSSTCIKKSRVCERFHLFRIKFYGSFDKPLGRYLRDDLFDETYCCPSCKEPTEAHVRCYTHPHGSLTIMVRRLPSVKLPGEHNGRIWMWHRCLKCKRDEDGVPPAAKRVIMSDAARGLSFGKFLELSFSSHATANRIASCGHSLQRDCLRFYGFGNMVAFFHYSPVDILSVCLPPSVLDFNCHVKQIWLKDEALLLSSKIKILHDKISDVLHTIERKITISENEPLKASIQRHINKLKNLINEDRYDYDVMLQQVAFGNKPLQETFDILELNRLRRALLLDSYRWDRKLYLLDLLSKEKNCTLTGSQFANFSSISDLSDLREEISWKNESFSNSPGEAVAKSSFSGTVEKSSFQKKKNEDLSLEVLDCNTNNIVEMDLSIESIEGYVGSSGFNFVSSQFEYETPVFSDSGSTVLENSTLPTSTLSVKIDLVDQPKGGSEVDKSVLLKDTPSYRRVNSPLRVHSFDSSLRFRKRVIGDFFPASLHSSSMKSYDSSGVLPSMTRDSLIRVRRAYSQSSPVPRLDNLLTHTLIHITSIMDKMAAGARLLLPQSVLDNIVIAVYDDEPSSIISYAMTTQQYRDYITSCLDKIEDFSMRKTSSFGNHGSNYADGTSLVSHHSDGPEEPQVSQVLDSKETHFRISFDDEYSIPSNKANFSVTCYFTKQFHALRKLCCPSELDYIRSLSRCKRWSAQGGKSNVYFAKSLDERLIIKQITKTELESFEDFASQYFKYLTQSITTGIPTSLAKVLGIYQVSVKHFKGGREMKIDVMVMENLFFNRSVSRIYDLKGSVRSRYNPDTSGNNTVLLDLNLLEAKPIFIGSKAKRKLERAVWNDTSFLAAIDVMDYSLLAGIDETKKELVIGIIDYMRQYTWDKQLETWVKASGILGSLKNAPPTVISPLQYKKRFRKAMSNYFLTVPDQ
ncbi:hypothetical protein ZIOFF_042364 [Zingiber officinale]|uniref:1-phosphatidylinositol-3-phosphate 5-kinase n=1 Tax=Zingiber officinale TaxID=94328 RepID=A0A8J5KTE6_ZINOF|nr:hypothetical protein ZIOFF_042364 [Zingiber officinale]